MPAYLLCKRGSCFNSYVKAPILWGYLVHFGRFWDLWDPLDQASNFGTYGQNSDTLYIKALRRNSYVKGRHGCKRHQVWASLHAPLEHLAHFGCVWDLKQPTDQASDFGTCAALWLVLPLLAFLLCTQVSTPQFQLLCRRHIMFAEMHRVYLGKSFAYLVQSRISPSPLGIAIHSESL